jgi:hypothetical protein
MITLRPLEIFAPPPPRTCKEDVKNKVNYELVSIYLVLQIGIQTPRTAPSLKLS